MPVGIQQESCTHGCGTGILRVRVWGRQKLPTGHLCPSLSVPQPVPKIVIGRGMANPQGWGVRVARVGVRVGIWLPLKNPYP